MLSDKHIFFNDNYLVLEVLYNYQQEVNNQVFTAITQQEIADILGYSIMKINSIMIKLKKTGYVISYNNTKGRYQLTTKSYQLITKINSLEA